MELNHDYNSTVICLEYNIICNMSVHNEWHVYVEHYMSIYIETLSVYSDMSKSGILNCDQYM